MEGLEERTYFQSNRTDLLKEYKGKLVFEGDDVSSGLYADPTNANLYNVTRAVNYNADTIRNSNGITVLPLFREALEFWNRHLAEVEKMMASDS
jgi:hypothetical protein